ncbi:MAG TPA: NAD-dependent epimerase/dehydratase family protein [Anaerolineales bacterium]|jgi:UDP-glucose 4-epimerase|nr:NAD-dependent epimerase/dehydratase family protein [Anaerolineales bacterium]
MRALVIGGNGFIGSHLVDRLCALGWEVIVLDLYGRRFGTIPPQVKFIRGDLHQDYLLRESLIGVEVVFHLAWTTIHEVSNQDPVADVYTNLVPSIHLLEACRHADIRRLVFVSSGGTVYGPARTLPIDESHATNPITAYGITKLAFEKYLHMFNQLYGLDYLVLRPSVPYGPRQNPLAKQGAVAVFLHRIGHNMPISLWGDGSATRDFFYISDLVDAFLAGSLKESLQNRVFNIGGGEEISLNQLICCVEETVGKPAIVNYYPARAFDSPRIVLDTGLAQREFNWKSTVSLAHGLRRTWDWISSSF